jgi:hypothetical protein
MNSPRCNAAQNTCTFSLIMCLKNLATNTLIPTGVATTARTRGSPSECSAVPHARIVWTSAAKAAETSHEGEVFLSYSAQTRSRASNCVLCQRFRRGGSRPLPLPSAATDPASPTPATSPNDVKQPCQTAGPVRSFLTGYRDHVQPVRGLRVSAQRGAVPR